MTTKDLKEEYLEWVKSPITLELHHFISDMVIDLREQLGQSAGLDPLVDRFTVGCIASLKDVHSWKPEVLSTEEEEQ